MKTQKIFFVLTMLMALGAIPIAFSSTPLEEEKPIPNIDDEEIATTDHDLTETQNQQTLTPLRGMSRFLASRGTMTCNKYPKVCRAKDSPGPDCCKKKCVNVLSDRLNCGKCGKKCKYAEICCKGKCVKPMSDKKNCGSCNNKCNKGSSCVFGICSYA